MTLSIYKAKLIFVSLFISFCVGVSGQTEPLQTGASSSYILGTDDVILISTLDEQEFGNKPLRIDDSGEVSLPLVGRLRASGLTLSQLEHSIDERLRRYVKLPRVAVTLIEFGSQPITLVGAVNTPGIQQARGSKKLLEVISSAGGIRSDAGFLIRVTREINQGPLQIPGAKEDPSGRFFIAELDLDRLLKGQAPEQNIIVKAHDTVAIPFADMFYVMGEVRKPGAFAVKRIEDLSALTGLSLAEGLTRTAAPKRAMILRRSASSAEREKIDVNLQKLLAGEVPDIRLEKGDILLVPNNVAKSATLRAIEAGIQVGTGLAVFRP